MAGSKKRRLQFGIRSILTLILISGIGSSFYRRFTAYNALDEIQKKAVFVRPTPNAKGWRRMFSNDVYRVNHLSFHNSRSVSDYDVAAITRLTWLKRLSLHRTGVSDRSATYVSKLRHLEALSFEGTKFTDKGMESLSGLKKLKSLSLNHTSVTERGLEDISKLTEMEMMLLTGWGPRVPKLSTFRPFRNMTKMKRFEYSGQVDPSSLRYFRDMPQMEKLLLQKVEVDNAALDQLAQMRSLRELYMPLSKLEDVGAEVWLRHPQLQNLSIRGDNVRIENHPSIQSANVMIRPVRGQSASGKVVFRDLPKLERIGVHPQRPCRLEVVECAELRQLTLRNIQQVKCYRLPNLATLVVQGGVKSLESKELPSLCNVRFENADVSSELLHSLAKCGSIQTVIFRGGAGANELREIEPLKQLTQFSNLKSLHVYSNHYRWTGGGKLSPAPRQHAAELADVLSKLRGLTNIEIPIAWTSPESIRALQQLKSLQNVKINCLNISQVTWKPLLELSNLQTLTVATWQENGAQSQKRYQKASSVNPGASNTIFTENGHAFHSL